MEKDTDKGLGDAAQSSGPRSTLVSFPKTEKDTASIAIATQARDAVLELLSMGECMLKFERDPDVAIEMKGTIERAKMALGIGLTKNEEAFQGLHKLMAERPEEVAEAWEKTRRNTYSGPTCHELFTSWDVDQIIAIWENGSRCPACDGECEIGPEPCRVCNEGGRVPISEHAFRIALHRVSDRKGATEGSGSSDQREENGTPEERGAHSDEQTPKNELP